MKTDTKTYGKIAVSRHTLGILHERIKNYKDLFAHSKKVQNALSRLGLTTQEIINEKLPHELSMENVKEILFSTDNDTCVTSIFVITPANEQLYACGGALAGDIFYHLKDYVLVTG